MTTYLLELMRALGLTIEQVRVYAGYYPRYQALYRALASEFDAMARVAGKYQE